MDIPLSVRKTFRRPLFSNLVQVVESICTKLIYFVMCTVYLFFGGMFFRNLDYFIFNEIKPLQSVLLPFCCCDFWIIVGIGSYASSTGGGRVRGDLPRAIVKEKTR